MFGFGDLRSVSKHKSVPSTKALRHADQPLADVFAVYISYLSG